MYHVGSNDGNYHVAETTDVGAEGVAPVDVPCLEDEHSGPSYHVDFGRLEGTKFETEWTLRDPA